MRLGGWCLPERREERHTLTDQNGAPDAFRADTGSDLLGKLGTVLQRYVALPAGGSITAALWTVFAHGHDAFRISPILTITSPVKRAGKTRLVELLSGLVPRPLPVSNITPAALFRIVDARAPTVLADEADTWFTIKEETRGVWNSGHNRQTAAVPRCEGRGVRLYSTWCPKVLSLIRRSPGDLPTTIEDRSILIRMHRRRADEAVERLRLDQLEAHLQPLRKGIAHWVAIHLDELRRAEPDVPAQLDDRAADNWRPLLAIADLAGGDWPDFARGAAAMMSGSSDEEDEDGIVALQDLLDVFARDRADRAPSAAVVEAMNAREDRPWGGTMTQGRLARLLRPFGIRPQPIWSPHPDGRMGTVRGYILADCHDAFRRYLGRA